uniref:Uncharacterized protein n=1 Tax=Oryza meridionalis TaxID=40149 RepID=A0A0E0F6B0_9ORYZ
MVFVYFIDNLIDTAKDVALLNSIIDVLREVKAHRKKLWNTWRASFIHTYCSSPWVLISIVTAFIILVATIMVEGYPSPDGSSNPVRTPIG